MDSETVYEGIYLQLDWKLKCIYSIFKQIHFWSDIFLKGVTSFGLLFSKLMFPLFSRHPEKGPRPKWTILIIKNQNLPSMGLDKN